MTGHIMEPTVLREYDIRGIVDKTLSTADAYAIGRAFATRVAKSQPGKRVCVGRDGRISSPAFEEALTNGLKDGGMEVLRVGLGPTPMLYYSVYHLEADGGIMVTGSHNPPDQNGFKFMIGHGPFYGEDIAEIGRCAAAGDYIVGEGSAEDRPLLDEYVARVVGDFKSGRDLTGA